MANSIKVKRSATPSAAPTTANLELGELAINTYDGRLYIKKDNGTASIVEVGTGSTAYTEYNFTATASQTTFAVGVSMTLVNVYANGMRLLPTTDYSISGTNIILTTGAGVSDIIVVLVYSNSAVGGTVTSVSVTTANGVSGTVATATTTPAITLSLTKTGTGTTYVTDTSPTLITPALGTPTALVGTNITGTATAFTASNVTTNANLTGGVTSVGNAATVVTNANLTGMVTSVGNAASLGSFTSAQLATALTDETGSGANVFATSPTLVTPLLGTPTSGVLTNCTFPTLNQDTTGTSAKTNALNSATTIVNVSSATAPTIGQILTATSGTAATWQTPAAGGVTTFNGSTTGLTPATATSGAITLGGTLAVANGGTGVTTSTGSGANVLSTSPTLVTPILGTPTSGNLANCTGIPAPAALSTASGSAPSYSARAWVKFNGTGTPAINGSGNVSSITDNGVGWYTVNFTTAMADANYAVTGFGQYPSGGPVALVNQDNTTDVWTTTAVSVKTVNSTTSTVFDFAKVAVSVFR